MAERLEPQDCPHNGAVVEAFIGGDLNGPPAQRGLPWDVIDPGQRDLDDIRAYVALGICGGCYCRVVSVRTWDTGGTPDQGLAWTTRWTRLLADGQLLDPEG